MANGNRKNEAWRRQTDPLEQWSYFEPFPLHQRIWDAQQSRMDDEAISDTDIAPAQPAEPPIPSALSPLTSEVSGPSQPDNQQGMEALLQQIVSAIKDGFREKEREGSTAEVASPPALQALPTPEQPAIPEPEVTSPPVPVSSAPVVTGTGMGAAAQASLSSSGMAASPMLPHPGLPPAPSLQTPESEAYPEASIQAPANPFVGPQTKLPVAQVVEQQERPQAGLEMAPPRVPAEWQGTPPREQEAPTGSLSGPEFPQMRGAPDSGQRQQPEMPQARPRQGNDARVPEQQSGSRTEMLTTGLKSDADRMVEEIQRGTQELSDISKSIQQIVGTILTAMGQQAQQSGATRRGLQELASKVQQVAVAMQQSLNEPLYGDAAMRQIGGGY